MERNTCYLNLSVAEAARTVSELVERAGLSSRMVDCHELRQGENLCGMVLLFEKYFLRMGIRLTLTAVLDNLCLLYTSSAPLGAPAVSARPAGG